MAMAQTQTEQINSPIITPLTIQAACQNSVKRERSEAQREHRLCHVGRIYEARPFRFPGTRPARRNVGTKTRRATPLERPAENV